LAHDVGADGLIIVVGSKNSSNTLRLTNLTTSLGVQTIQIDTVAELDLDFLRQFEKVGITSGASVPDDIVDELCGVIAGL
jgi:4-hydroxy-3-methylbut-2-enyl diphosphate reductase